MRPSAFSSLLRCACPAPEHVAGEIENLSSLPIPFFERRGADGETGESVIKP